MEVYKQGLNNVDRKHRHILHQQYNLAQAKNELRIDIPGLAPYDIVASIAKHLAVKEPNLVLLNVSKIWRSRFSQCPSIWSTLFIDPHNDRYTTAEVTSLGHQVGLHVLNITLYAGTAPFRDALFRGMMNGYFNNLVHLTLSYYTAYPDSKLLAALEQVSGTLTTLYITLSNIVTTSNGDGALPYKSIISVCRNLECFRYNNFVGEISGAAAGSLEPEYTSKLTELRMNALHLELDDVEDILRACPELRLLKLDECTSAVVNVALTYCRALEIICLRNEIDYIDHCWLDEYRSLRPSKTGIRALTAAIEDHAHFTRLFMENHSIIQALSLRFVSNPFDHWTSFMIPCGDLCNLVLLILECASIAEYTAAAALIRKSPALRRLKFSCPGASDFGTSMLSAIVDAPQLQELDITIVTFNKQNFRVLFEGIAANGRSNKSLLQKITLSTIYCDAGFTIDNVLNCICDITLLREVEITQCRSVSEWGINRFCEKLRSHPSIQAIKFEDLNCVTDESLKYLAAIEGLRNLNMTFIPGITKEGIKVFLPIKLKTVGSRGVVNVST